MGAVSNVLMEHSWAADNRSLRSAAAARAGSSAGLQRAMGGTSRKHQLYQCFLEMKEEWE